MATAKSTSTTRKTTQAQTAGTHRSDTAQVKEGVTKTRNGVVSIAVSAAERAVDVPVGAVLVLRERVEDAIEPWTTDSARERELRSLRTQVTRELNKFERRGGQARRKAEKQVRTTRTRVEREVKSRRREVEKAVKANRLEVEKTVKENRTKAGEQLKKARTVVQERVPSLAS